VLNDRACDGVDGDWHHARGLKEHVLSRNGAIVFAQDPTPGQQKPAVREDAAGTLSFPHVVDATAEPALLRDPEPFDGDFYLALSI
jgi:hypothetical protein